MAQTKNIQLILREILEKVEPPKQDLEKINKYLKQFKEKIEKQIKRQKFDAVLFEGGSFAKKTIIKKDNYDVDIFLMFSEKFKGQNISKLTKKLLKGIKGVSIIHGSRDYFQINESKDFVIELIPVIKATDPKKAENITDLSYSHVKYINKKIKNQKILDEIKIAKAFCYATKTYGAESYINGFSGYSLELLIYHYKSFLNFIKTIANYNAKEKIIIDIEKHYKKKNDVLLDMNSSKLTSPIILVDPTYKQRNALAALSEETFEKFKQASKKFLKNPSIKYFEIVKWDLEKIKKDALKKKYEFILLELKTKKPKGAVAGSKLLKFYNHLENEIKMFFEVKNKGFDYDQNNNAHCFFVAKKKQEIIKQGPFLKDKSNVKQFRKERKNSFEKAGRIYAREKINFTLKEFIENWQKKYQKKISEMSISE
ncbi:MAG: hypothetical protein AABY06_02670, partial [Nanoarchaeota archaeon]